MPSCWSQEEPSNEFARQEREAAGFAMEATMQEYWPALLPLVIGLSAFAVGMLFVLRERNTVESRKLHNLEREQLQHESRKSG